MFRFDAIFPNFIAKCADLHALLRPVAFLLFIVGILLLAAHRLSARVLLLHLIRLTVLMSLLVLLPTWGNEVQRVLQASILDGLGVDPSKVHERYQELLLAKRDLGTGKAWWDLIAHLRGMTVEVVITGALWLLGSAASLLLFWAYVFQKVILFVGYALSPLLIGFMAIRELRSIGSRYLLNLMGVLLWPLGWGVAALVTDAILDYMSDPAIKLLDPTLAGYQLQTMFGLGVVSFWVVTSTVAAPLIIQKVFTTGAQAGGELLSHLTGSFLQTAAATAGAAAVGASTGLPWVTAAAAGTAAALSAVSTAAGQGSAGAILIAGSGLPPRSARGRPGDDITGDRAVRELLARRKNPYS